MKFISIAFVAALAKAASVNQLPSGDFDQLVNDYDFSEAFVDQQGYEEDLNLNSELLVALQAVNLGVTSLQESLEILDGLCDHADHTHDETGECVVTCNGEMDTLDETHTDQNERADAVEA